MQELCSWCLLSSIQAQELAILAICRPMQESLGGQDMDEPGTSENGPRQPLHPLPTRASLADRLPPRPSELLKVCGWFMRSRRNSTAACFVRILLPARTNNAKDWVQACRPLQKCQWQGIWAL